MPAIPAGVHQTGQAGNGSGLAAEDVVPERDEGKAGSGKTRGLFGGDSTFGADSQAYAHISSGGPGFKGRAQGQFGVLPG